MTRAGEAVHALQPPVYILLIYALGRRLGPGRWRRRLPYLAAFALEAAALALCARGVRRDAPSAAYVPADACELRHRRKLLILLLLRPAARAGTRAALAGLAGAATSPSLRGWCASALELVEGLEHSVAFRYFR